MLKRLSTTVMSLAVLAGLVPSQVLAQTPTATFTDISDAVPNRCYDPATTGPDPANPNRLVIGMHTGIVPGTFGINAGCVASDKGSSLTTDTLLLVAHAPAGYYISRITFAQTLTTSGSRGGRGFASAQWVVDDDARSAGGAFGVADLTGLNKTVVPLTLMTYLAAAGGTVRSGSATASNASVLVELLPLVGEPPPPPPPPPANPAPEISALSPSQVIARGPSFTVTVTGNRFVAGSLLQWNGVNRPTTVVSGTQLRAAIAAADIAVPGPVEVRVFNPSTPFYGSDGGVSGPLTLTVNPSPDPHPVPVATSLSPAAVVAGSNGFTLTVHGTNFVPGAVIRWGTANQPTAFVDSTRLTATVPAALVGTTGTVTVTVFNPPTGFNPPPAVDGGTSEGLVFTVSAVPVAPPPAPGPAPDAAHGNVNDMRGKEWRQLTQTSNLTRAQLEVVCPRDGITPCAGRAGNVDVTGWVWANQAQVFGLLSYFTTGVAPATPRVAGLEYAAPATQFQALFALTHRATGASCTTSPGCWDSRTVAGLTSSFDDMGAPIAGEVNLTQNASFAFQGGFRVGDIPGEGGAGRGVFLWRPTGLGAGTPHALSDVGQSPSPLGGTALNVMLNDWVNGVQATAANAVASLSSPPSPETNLLTVNADGAVRVAPGLLEGSYTLGYALCATGTSACDTAQATVVIRSFPITAVNDSARASFASGGSPVNVLANDTVNGLVATPAIVSLRQVSSTHPNVSLNLSTGAVTVEPGTPNAPQLLVYEICERARPANCKQATVSLTGSVIDAVNDVFPKLSKDGGTSPSVLTNDRLNGAAASAATVQLSLLTALPAGITFDLATGRFVVSQTESGDYFVTYRICEIASPTNCDTASLTLEISGSAD